MFARFILFFCFLLGTIQANAGIFSFPLCQGATNCSAYPQGAYTAGVITSLLDHSMKYSSDWPYGTVANGGGDGTIKAFNGETVSGTPFAYGNSSTKNCIPGVINIYPDPPLIGRLMNSYGCGTNGTSYEDHPGYDYLASYGTPVYAAATGYTVSSVCKLRNMGGTCDGWGGIGIVTPSGYVYQYFHLYGFAPNVRNPGATITEGQFIGYAGNAGLGCTGTACAHLHFEVIYWSNINNRYVTIDPYGWVGGGTDPLQTQQQPGVPPQNLWK